MVSRLALCAATVLCASSLALAEASPVLPLAAHRAAYDISLADSSGPTRSSAQTPISATGLIAYEFRGSACEGYTSNFRQMTEMERSEGDPVSMQVNATSFEEGSGKSMRFQVESHGAQDTPPVVGTATRGGDDELRVVLTKPKAQTLDFGHEVLFPTQHIERLIEAAKHGGGADAGARLRRLRHRRENLRDHVCDWKRSDETRRRHQTPPRRSAEFAAGQSSSPTSTKPRATRRLNTRFRSTFMRMASRAASSSTTAPSPCARVCASSRFCLRQAAPK